MSREVFPNFKQPAKRKPSRASADVAWSKAVRKRDGSRCQFPSCGQYDKHIATHHIASRKQRPDLRHDLANGVCLCLEHHHWVHAHPVEAAELGLVCHERYEKARNNLSR